MTIQFKTAHSIYNVGQIVTLDAGVEAQFIAGNLARNWYAGIDGGAQSFSESVLAVLAGMSGYSGTGTRTLKVINGVMTFVQDA